MEKMFKRLLVSMKAFKLWKFWTAAVWGLNFLFSLHAVLDV